jgi:hypothetical protein
MNALQLTAEKWVNDGVAVIPVAYRDKRPTLATWREFQDRLPTKDEIARWFRDRFHNLAIVTGWRGLTVLDFDNKPLYRLWREWSMTAAPKARFSYTVETARGVHVYFFLDEPVQTMKAGTIDVKAGGGYVLAPPSIHPTGRRYQLLSDAPILRVDRLACIVPASLLAVAQPEMPRPERVRELAADSWQAAMNPGRLADSNTIVDIAARYSLLDLFPGARRRGGRYWANCPLHDDKNASLTIDLDGRHAKCWAGCLNGDYLDWYGRINGLTLAQTMEVLG